MNSRGNNKKHPKVISDDEESISDDEFSENFIQLAKKPKIVRDGGNTIQWIDKYTPKTSDEICINPRKLKEVKEALTNMIKGADKTRLLILAGPSGSSKSTTIKILANELLNQLQPERTGIENYFDDNDNNNENRWIEYLDSTVLGVNQSNQFDEFLNDSKFKINSVILVEELPNIFNLETLRKFRNSIKEWVLTDSTIKLPPLVLCLSEVELLNESSKNDYFSIENNLTIDTLLGKEIIGLSPVKVIKFNSIALTFIKKLTSKIISNERTIFSRISKIELNKFLDNLIEIGDVRSLISNLQFWASLKSKSNDSETNMELNFLRENKINLFHAIGKIIFSSSKFKNLSDKEKSDYLSIKSVLDDYITNNASLLNLSILENYHIYNNSNYDVEVAGEILNNLSIGDFLNSIDEGKEIGIRSARIELRKVNVITSKQPNIKFPRHFKMLREFNKTYKDIRLYQKFINGNRNTFNDLNLIDGYYLPMIYNSYKYRKMNASSQKILYNRLGGKFKEIYAEESLPIYEEDDGGLEGNFNKDQFQIDLINKMNEANEVDDDYDHDTEELSDPIETSGSDSDDDIFNDSIDDVINALMMSQVKKGVRGDNISSNFNGTSKRAPALNNVNFKHKSMNNDSDDSGDFSSDPELDILISQGKF